MNRVVEPVEWLLLIAMKVLHRFHPVDCTYPDHTIWRDHRCLLEKQSLAKVVEVKEGEGSDHGNLR